MPAALAAVLLLAATVDPRLVEPLCLFAQVGARGTTDGHLAPYFAELPESLGLTLPDHRCNAHHMILWRGSLSLGP